MAKYYLKKLGKQELGIKSDGTIARGRYIYISKATEDFFPYLSKTVTNDNILIPVIPPFSDVKIYSTYVYHNDKFNLADGTRDEYRLYLNRELDPGRSYYQVNDIVVFERIETDSLVPIYVLYRYQPNNTDYNELDTIIVYFGETDQVIPWQTDHLFSWRTVAVNAVEACTKIVI